MVRFRPDAMGVDQVIRGAERNGSVVRPYVLDHQINRLANRKADSGSRGDTETLRKVATLEGLVRIPPLVRSPGVLPAISWTIPMMPLI